MAQIVPLIVAACTFGLAVRWVILGRKVGFGWSAAQNPQKAVVIRKVCVDFLIFIIFLAPLVIGGYL